MTVALWLLLVLVVWSLLACVVGLVVGGAARLRDSYSTPGSGVRRSAARPAA